MDVTRFATQPALRPVMKGLAFLLTPAFGVLLLSLCSGVQGADKLTIQVDPGTTYQTIDGFGASDAWRCQFVGKNWPLEKREHIADLLFSRETDDQGNPRGIGLSIWRFYLSAGTAEQGEDSDIGNPWRRGECFLNADGDYDWTKLVGQQWFLRAARERGVERLLAFPNAPPVHLSKNGKGYATQGDIHLNVKPGCLDDYANYLVEIVDHFEKVGLPFDYLSPVPGSGGRPLPRSISKMVWSISTMGRKATPGAWEAMSKV